MLTAIVIVTVLLAIGTFLPVLSVFHWTVRGWDFPRLQVATLAACLIFLQLIYLDLSLTHSMIMVAVTVGCLCWQLWWILPYTKLWPLEALNAEEIIPENTLSVLSVNVLKFNKNVHSLIELVHQHAPDILVTLETDTWWQEQLVPITETLPYTVACPLDNLYGMHLFSKKPLVNPSIRFLVEDDVPSIHTEIKLNESDSINAFFLHPAPPSPSENEASKERDIELMLIAKLVKDLDSPILIAGDLNDVAWSRTTRLFRKISGLLDPRVGRGMFNTFHAQYPLIRWPLDHIFHSEHFKVVKLSRLMSIGSDHFPLYAKIALTHPKRDQEGLSEEKVDREQAKAILKEQATLD